MTGCTSVSSRINLVYKKEKRFLTYKIMTSISIFDTNTYKENHLFMVLEQVLFLLIVNVPLSSGKVLLITRIK